MQELHLLAVFHGMWGQPAHVSTVAQIIQQTFSDQQRESATDFNVLLVKTNSELHTYDGIDWCGERAVKEIMARKRELEKDGLKRVTRFSVFGYSLGGLVARYSIGILHSRQFFDAVVPINFATFATPHIGIVDYNTLWSKMVKTIGSRLLSRTGQQFFARDKWSPEGQPLLLAMADNDKIIYKALCLFPNLRIYANGVKDRTVPFVTGYITTQDPFLRYPENGVQVTYDPNYYPIIASYDVPEKPPAPLRPIPFYRRLAFPLPPWLDKGMPLNLIIYALLPLLLPAILVMMLFRFARASRASRRRIEALETDIPAETRLVWLWRELRQEMGEALAEAVQVPPVQREANLGTPEVVYASRTSSPIVTEKLHQEDDNATAAAQKGGPVLTAHQKQIVANLNSIPHMKKYIVFTPQYTNAHPIIVCREPAQFPEHEEGKGAIRHWADMFEF